MAVEIGDNIVVIATITLILHILAAVAWVGGMFFALMVLRPSSGALEPAVRLALWRRVFDRFFPWVFVAIVLLLASGYAMVFGVFGGFAGIGLHVHIMQGTGILMMLIFLHLYFAPWRRFKNLLDAGNVAGAAVQLGQIRTLVAINLVLGLVTVAVGSSGRYWG